MRKTITVNYLNKLGACPEAIEMFKNQRETNSIKILQGCMKINHFDWANWLIVRLMNRKQKLQYSIFAAESVIDIYEKKYPDDKRPRETVDAAKAVLKHDSKKNRASAHAAANAANAANAAAAANAANAAHAAYYAAAHAAANAANAAHAAAAAHANAAHAAYYAAHTAAHYAAYYAAAAAAHAAAAANAAYYTAANAAYYTAARKKLQKKIINYGIKVLE